ncbi:MAG: hypothetical protein KBA26_10415 [Candidatus Delongbacteria bacterium]|nr:hypothetical protein [Candidatus Delongbacteria bacterium]
MPSILRMLYAAISMTILCSSGLAQFRPGDPVIYSRYYIMMTDLDEVVRMRVEKIRNEMVVIRHPEGFRVSTHITSLQPIFDPDHLREDRTIGSLRSLYPLDSLISFTITSRDLAGPLHENSPDSIYYSGQQYNLVISGINQHFELILVDTFIYKNPGLTLQGINDGKPDYYILQYNDSRILDTCWQSNPLWLDCFYKIDALKLLIDEQLDIRR